MRHMSQSGNYTRRRRVYLNMPDRDMDRVEFIRKALGLANREETISRAVRLLDRVVCGVVIEGDQLFVRCKTGRLEPLDI